MGLTTFTVLAVVAGVSLLLLAANKLLVDMSESKVVKYLSALSRPLQRLFIVSLAAMLIVFSMASIVPYTLNQTDAANISYQENNIILYEEEIEKYSEAARSQIEEYQRLQSEMARRASSTQLQFWAEQQDEVGNALTNRIQDFEKMILDARIEINKRQAMIDQRSLNKWYFWHKLVEV